MFSNLSSTTKKFIINGMVVISIMLFIFSFFIGKNLDEEKEQSEKEMQEEETGENFSHSDSVSTYNNEQPQNEHDHEHYEYENPEVDKEDKPTEKATTLIDLFPKEDIESSKKVAKSFIEGYYAFNGDKPMENIKKSKEHMSESLFERLSKLVTRPTQTIFKKELSEIEVYEPYNPTNDYISWNVRVQGKVFDSEGELTKEDTYDYFLKMIKEDGEYKVDDFSLNKAHKKR